MISHKGYRRLAANMRNSGLFDYEKEEDYTTVANYVELALLELYKAIDVQDSMTIDGWQYLMSIVNELRDFQKNFDQFKIIPLR
jgi:hypothetical protein